MTVPTVVGRWLFTTAFTAGKAASVVARAAAGDPGAVARITPEWAGGLARAWGMEVVAHGTEHVRRDQTYVFMANHQSHADVVAILEALPVLPGFLAKKELRRIPFLGRAMEVAGHVFIDRTRRERAFAAIAEAAAQVRAGSSIVVFPEGTRADRPGVKPLKKGGFHLARQAGVPIVPVGIRGSGEVLRKHSQRIRPGRVEVLVGAPIPADRVTSLPLGTLMDEVRATLCELSALPPVAPDRA